MSKIARIRRSERGQSFVEYSLLLVLIAAVAILVLTGMGTSIVGVYAKITNLLNSASANVPNN